MAANTLGRNITFQIYNGDGTPFEGLILHKSVVDSVVMSLGDNITGDVYYKNNALNVTMNEYIEYKGVKYVLVNPPTILREGMVKDNGELKGMTKYSFTFYHPMYQLGNMPFCDVAVSSDQQRYLSENKVFSWIGYPNDYIAKLNKNLDGTEWIVEKSNRFPALKDNVLSEVLSFENNTIADALKTFYDTWEVPYVVDVVSSGESSYAQGKRFKVVVGLPSNEIYASESDKQLMQPYVFRMGQGVGLKNNSRTPRNNKIITRISGYGSEDNIPYGYPQIVWDGAEDDPRLRYPLYDGIVGGRYVKLIKHPFTRTHLMPSIYSETVNKKVNPNAVGYDPTIELKDYYDAIRTEEYPYVNEINPLAPSYESHEFDVKPEMNDGQSNVEILDAIPLNADLTPAESWDDTMGGDGNYLQSYFQITLPVLSFDLYACAAITQEMSINMRGGACIGCTFPIQVNWDDYKANFYDQDGNFAPDGEQRDLTKYPKSNLESISVVVQKEYQTFGTVMPNVFQQPKNGDEFVVLGISLPSEYISDAEERLDREMKSYMLENNIYYFDYPLKFDEYFLATHTYILEQLKPNSVVRFDFAGNELQLFVKQLTIKYGENVLPQYDITLTDNVEVVLNQIGQVAEDVERLSSVISILRESYGRNVWTELSKKLSKVNDDTAQGFIRFIKGLQVGERFVSGLLGEGAVFRKEADGTTYLEADKMYIRMKAYFDTVEIRKYLHSAGNRVASDAGAKCIRVEYIGADGNVTSDAANAVVFRCYFRGSDGDDEVTNDFLVGDQVYCHITNGSTQSLQMHHYWRLLVGRNAEGELTEDGEHWIDLSNRPTETVTIDGSTYTHAGYQTGSDIPVAQDDMVQLGNINDTTRQGAIIEYVSGADSPSYQIYQGINDFSLDGKNQLALGYNTQTGRAYLNVYGDAYIGDRNGASYIRYNTATKKMEIKAEVNIQSTFDGKTLPDYIAEHSSDWTEEEITALFTDDFNNIDAEIKNIQKQVDGSIETWFYNGVPSSSVLPESEWKAKDIAAGNNNERLKHLGDLYYDNQSGYAYRYTNQGTESVPQFVWTQISDSAVIKALENAAKAQDTADHKRRVFVRQPLDSEDYDVGDLWVNATYPSGNTQTDDANGRYYNDILKCIKHKDKNVAFSISDWGLSSKYTDDSALEQFKLNSYVQQLTGGELSQDIADAKQAADDAQADADAAAAAAANAKTAADKAQADATAANNRLNGWANDGSISPTEKTSLKLEWENVKKEYTQICNDADKYGVSTDDFVDAYTSANSAFLKYTAATPENITIGSDYDNIKAYYQARQTILDAITQAAKKVATDAATAAANAQAKADSAYTLAGQANAHAALFDSIRTALNQGTLIDGGLVLSTLIGLRDGDNKLWSGISGAYNTDLFGGGLAAWYGGGLADAEHKSQYPSGSDWAKSAFRFDGSGYLAGGNITWDKDGIVTIANVYSDVSGTKVPLSGTSLQYLNNIVNLLPTKLIDGVNYIDPKTSFTTINALNEIKINGKQVATQEYVSQNYLSIAFFKRLFQAHNRSANVNPNDTSTTITDIEAMFGFWTNQYISALGNGSGGSGGGGVGDVTWDLLASNSDTRPIALSHLTGALSGYALTSQLSNYLPLSGGTLTGNLTIATSDYATQLTIKRSDSGNDAVIRYENSEGFLGMMGIHAVKRPYFTSRIDGGGVEWIWTSGNLTKVSQLTNDAGYITSSASITGNADSATKLQTARAIWGQSFDGSSAISGNMTGVTDIDGLLGFGTRYGYARLNIHEDGVNDVAYIDIHVESLSSSYTTTRPLVLQNGYGNVGIGVTQPSYKLHVDGAVGATSFIMSGGTSSQFLKADGSVDSNSYALASSLSGYLPLTGGTMTGDLYIHKTNAQINLRKDSSSAGAHIGYDDTDNQAYYGVSTSPYPQLRLDKNEDYPIFRYNNVNHKIWHSGNSNLSTVDWNAQSLSLSSDINILTQDQDKSINFWYTSDHNAEASWRIISEGTGSGDANYLSIQTGGTSSQATVWHNVLRCTMDNRYVGINVDTVNYQLHVGGNINATTIFESGRPLSSKYLLQAGGEMTGNLTLLNSSNGATPSLIFKRGEFGDDYWDWKIYNVSGFLYFEYNDADGWHRSCDLNQNVLSVNTTLTTHNVSSYASIGMSAAQTDYNLYVNGISYFSNNIDGANSILLSKNVTSDLEIKLTDTSNNRAMSFMSGASKKQGLYHYSYGWCYYIDTDNKMYLSGDHTTSGNHCVTGKLTVGANSFNTSYGLSVTGSTAFLGGNIYLCGAKADSSTGNTTQIIIGTPSSQHAAITSNSGCLIINSSENDTTGQILFGTRRDSYFSSGKLGIGTTSPSYKLHVNGTSYTTRLYLASDVYLEYDSANGGIHVVGAGLYSDTFISALGAGGGGSSSGGIDADWLKNNDVQIKRLGIGIAPSSSYYLYVNGSSYFNGNVGIGTTSPNVKLDVNGVARATELRLSHGFYIDWNSTNASAYTIGEEDMDIYADGDWYGRWASSSDVRLKDIDQYLDGKLEDIALAPIFSFRWKNKPNKPLELGTSAQYWKVHLPYGVTQTHSGYLALDYGATALAAAVFTARKVVDHELRIKQLEQENMELREEIKQLKAA